ncbi:Strand exchange protein (5'-3' exoribonuclease), putative [Cryptococcus gattii WM276]|uniref:5'-3' exoribonuclease n=2 Tax=Cryptococcus gattii TaxID=37769 RepID=E6R8B5_CRYGW|nr:Strand exchange protein (5'-3' exoribonuclease), putative [Cryptococcus gattii WM276]ADV23068.1 Strand exchange protein (5'-3' exoribonuclease), putative [Cryptococcus gattii WM276]KIR82477.1 5'-3' exoribonuclease 2 [Cryptococcus gattii EJB2]KJE04156.1 5'-3' exoribonuclease 2 [Cryptococcus gattii NT-10]
MGVPALFRWLSKKYPKIVERVKEDTPKKIRGPDGEIVEEPIRYENPNPNGFEVDNLYLDMNGIVHPCTHPEGRPAPETEEEMMVEIFKYTERVVNMCRPRKVLMMAIDGVAPRAKMNQQRSRRFRAAQEAADKEEERKEAVKLFEAMGHTVSEETANRKSWDTNAITPGTPFMDLLSISLKYWVSYKLTTDPGWKDLKIILSDSSVPGEGEHKIMDWIRRQRSYPTWDANTSHVIYGLDADLIMLSLATHEPHFRVLREDVFAQSSKGPPACKNCGKVGHIAANCKGDKKVKDPNVVEVAKTEDPKPFIFLDVACLREYLAIELVVPGVPFPFDLELAIDDWIFMIFFVGNDFLPHLPSLEIREGAIDVLLKIWRAELPRMGGYLTNHGKVNLDRAQVILEGLAKSEDEIFQKRKDDEERQEHSQKRRRIEEHKRQDEDKAREVGRNALTLNGTEYVAVDNPAATARGGPLHPSLPSRPAFDLVPKEEAAKPDDQQQRAKKAMAGSNSDIVKNRKAIRMANMSAAQALKAELEGSDDVNIDDKKAIAQEGKEEDEAVVTVERTEDEEKEQLTKEEARGILDEQGEKEGVDEEIVPPAIQTDEDEGEAPVGDATMAENDDSVTTNDDEDPTHVPRKRKRGDSDGDKESNEEDEDDDEDDDDDAPPNPEADQPIPKKKLRVNADGTVDYEDDIKLWEPGYRERYYEKKFGVKLSEREFIDKVTKSYMEGLCWVLEYYYQGVPAWDWFYPYHYAPFAQDFRSVGSMDIKFETSMPFKPFAQLLGVFPAASRIHLPEPLQTLMIDEDSPILDFYPPDFEIDMNGKKMAWQGVALLPFIDQNRLLTALKSKEELLSDDEKRRNSWGDNVMFIANENPLYDLFCDKLYGLRAKDPIPIDTKASYGMTGSVLPDPNCVPASTFDTPIPSISECPDLNPNDSISVRYYFPRQAHPHRSILLRGYRPEPARLTESDKDWVRRGGQGGRRGHRQSGGGNGNVTGGPGMARGRYESGPPRTNGYQQPPPRSNYGGGSGYGYGAPAPLPSRPPISSYGGGAGGYGYGNPYAAAPNPYAGGYGAPAPYAAGGYDQRPYVPPLPPPNPYSAPPPTYGRPPAGGYGYGAPPPRGGGYNPYTSRR